MKSAIRSFTLFALIILMLPETMYSIPAFARKYRMSCQTCHSPIPRLKPYGDEFAGNGFVLADQDAPRYFVETGDEDLSLIRDFPIAIRLDAYATYRNKDKKMSDLKTPLNLKLLTGGALTKDISYYFYFFLSEGGEIVGIEDAFIMFNNLFNTELDLYVGQFQISDPLFKRELRLTFEDYHAYKNAVGISQIDLTYDRGIMLTYGFETGTDIIVEVLNGSGIGVKNDLGNFDNDEYKNFFGRVSQDIIDGIRVGAFGFTGKEELTNELGSKATNDVTMFGPDITLNYNDILELNAQYTFRKDGDLFLTQNSLTTVKDIETKGFMGELIFTPQRDESKWYAAGVYNWMDSDYDPADYKTLTGHVGYILKRNMRLVSEFTYDFVHKFGQFGVGVITAF